MSGLICQLLYLFTYVVIARILLSWFPLQPGGIPAQIFSFTYTITEPVLGPVRRAIPAIGMFDLSPIVVIIGIQLLMRVIERGM